MVLVEGDYCPEVEQVCLRWVDAKGHPTKPPVSGKTGRCKEFRRPTRCLSTQNERKRFCIDTYEYPNVKGSPPLSWMSWQSAKTTCESQDKRLCKRSEWTFACEGPAMHPYPYGDGYVRDRTACNFDNDSSFVNVNEDTREKRTLDVFLMPSGQNSRCVSPFGVYDQVGNIDESVVNETHVPYESGLMGGHVFGVRNACRPMTEVHNETFVWYETGFRCCLSH